MPFADGSALTASALNDIQAVPASVIAFWDGTAATIPAEYTEYTFGRGRFIVGMPSGGTSGSASTVGTALTDKQNPSHAHAITTHEHTIPAHSHAITAHGHPQNVGGQTTYDSISASLIATGTVNVQMGTWQDAGTDTVYKMYSGVSASGTTPTATAGPASTGASGTTPTTASGATGDIAPYIQLLGIKKT